MNEHDAVTEPPEGAVSALHPALAEAMRAERARPAEDTVPDPRTTSVEVAERSVLATHADPSTVGASPSGVAAEPQRGRSVRTAVTWVRPTELVAQSSAKVMAVGIDLQAELTRRLRAATGEAARRTVRAVSERAGRLPDPSRRARRAPAVRTVERSEMGRR